MAGIGLIGGIGQALVDGGGGVLQGKEDQRIIDLQNEQLEQQREDRRRKQEREDYTFDRVKDAGEAEDEQNEQSLFDYANKGLDPWNDLEKLIDMPVRPGKTKTMGDVDPNAISTGLLEKGNIPLKGRPLIDMGTDAKGNPMVGSEYSTSFEENGKEVLVPTIYDGKRHTPQEAWQHYQQTGEHMGKYDSPEHADAAAEIIHSRPFGDDGDSLGKLPGGAEPKPRTGKTPAMNKMTLGDFADQGEEVKRKIALARDDYEKHRQKVQDDAMAIVKRFSGNPEMQKRKLSAYYRAMTASSDFKTREANYQNLLEKAKQVKIAETSLEVLKAIRSGDEETMKDLGLVNSDGSVMKVARDRTGLPIGLVGPFGIWGQRSIAAAAGLEKGIGTFDGLMKAMEDDQKMQESLNKEEGATQRSYIHLSTGTPDRTIERAEKVASLNAQIRKEKDPERKQYLQDMVDSLKTQTPDNTRKSEDRDQEFKLKALNSHVKSCAWAKGKGKPTANEVIKGYETLQAMTDTETADMYLAQVTSSWSKHGEDLMRSADNYWKSKAHQLNPTASAQNR